MKPKHLSLAIAALLAAGGLWFAWHTSPSARPKLGGGIDPKTITDNGNNSSEPSGENPARGEANVSLRGQPTPRQMLRPPDPTKRFIEFTPEQRVQFARQGHGPGG